MSQQLWNIHNYRNPPQPRPGPSPIYQIPHNDIGHVLPAEAPTGYVHNFAVPFQAVVPHGPSPQHSEYQLTRNRLELSKWRQKASVEDWKAYLYSPTAGPIQTQNFHEVHRQMTPYSYNVQTSGNNPNLRRYIPEHSQFNNTVYQHFLNGHYKNVTNETRHRDIVDSRRVMTCRQAGPRYNGLYQNRAEKRRDKSQYSNFSPELIRYVDPSQLEKEPSDLAYIEILMCNQNRDGYVTLDDKAMNILVNAIDKVLPKNLNLQKLAELMYN